MSGLVGLHHVQLAAPVGSEPALRRFYVADPHGNRIELVEPLEA